MVNLHGCLQDGDLFRERGNWEATAETFGMIVALPTVPEGGKIAGCWDYWGKPSLQAPSTPPHTRQNRDNDNILALVARLLDDEMLGIDPKQVYLSGLSSGGGETLVLGCLAPDIFAGIGIVAGPSLGTASDEINRQPLPVGRDQVVGACESLAGANAAHLATQVASLAFGSNDPTVNRAYNRLNAEALAEIYGATPSGTFDLSGLPGFQPQGQGSLWNDAKGPRVSLVPIGGMGHAWPAGSGLGGEQRFVASRGLNYPAYLTKFLTDNNRRLTPPPPSLTAAATVDQAASTVRISGEASAADGSLDALRIELAGLSEPTFRFGPAAIPQPSPPAFGFTSEPLPTNASYKATVRALDAGAEATAELVFGVGPNPPFPPVLGEVMSSVDRGCVALFGSVEDRNGNLDAISVAIDGSPVGGVVLHAERNAWTLGQPVCALPPGHHDVVVTAVDVGGLRSEPGRVGLEIPVPFITLTDTLNGHVVAQRVRFYPEAGHFGAADVPFTTLVMRHGSSTPFPLFGIDSVFFANRPGTPASVAASSLVEPAAGPRAGMTAAGSDPLVGFLNALVAAGADVSINISRPTSN
jgi:poly(3-hydroxybutyrate) depolymerase